jgi:Tol biopolymer transport system component
MIVFFDREDENHIQIVPVSNEGEVNGDKITIDAPEGTGGIRNLAGWTSNNKIGVICSNLMEFGLYTMPAKGGRAALVLHGGYPTQPRWSPDGKRIFLTNNKDDENGDWAEFAIASIPAEGGSMSTIPIQSDEKIYKPAWGSGNNVSPDGKMIAFTAQTEKDSSWHWQLWTMPINGGKATQLTKTPSWVIHGYPCWSPDGKYIAFVHTKANENYTKRNTETNIYMIPASGGDPLPLTVESDSVNFTPIAWSPDGKYIAFYSDNELNPDELVLKIISTDNRDIRELATFEGIGIHNELAWSPDSKRIALNGPENIITAISIKDGSIEEIETGLHDVEIYHFDWSPDGDRFVFAGYRGGDSEFWLLEDFVAGLE